jgi:hypothetical protein
LGCRVQESKLRELLGALSHCPLPRVVIEDFDGSSNFTILGSDRTSTHFHRNSVATLVVKVNLRPTRSPILHSTAERAVSLTEETPTFINMHKKVVRAALSHYFFGNVSSKFFRRLVPVGNPTVAIGEVDAVKKFV